MKVGMQIYCSDNLSFVCVPVSTIHKLERKKQAEIVKTIQRRRDGYRSLRLIISEYG